MSIQDYEVIIKTAIYEDYGVKVDNTTVIPLARFSPERYEGFLSNIKFGDNEFRVRPMNVHTTILCKTNFLQIDYSPTLYNKLISGKEIDSENWF